MARINDESQFAKFLLKMQEEKGVFGKPINIEFDMEDAGLNEEQKAAIRTADVKKIRQLLTCRVGRCRASRTNYSHKSGQW